MEFTHAPDSSELGMEFTHATDSSELGMEFTHAPNIRLTIRAHPDDSGTAF